MNLSKRVDKPFFTCYNKYINKRKKVIRMIYIIMFIIMCWLDWKLDTYAGFKFLGSFVLGGLIFFGGLMLYSDKQTEVSTTQETFISGNFSEETH